MIELGWKSDAELEDMGISLCEVEVGKFYYVHAGIESHDSKYLVRVESIGDPVLPTGKGRKQTRKQEQELDTRLIVTWFWRAHESTLGTVARAKVKPGQAGEDTRRLCVGLPPGANVDQRRVFRCTAQDNKRHDQSVTVGTLLNEVRVMHIAPTDPPPDASVADLYFYQEHGFRCHEYIDLPLPAVAPDVAHTAAAGDNRGAGTSSPAPCSGAAGALHALAAGAADSATAAASGSRSAAAAAIPAFPAAGAIAGTSAIRELRVLHLCSGAGGLSLAQSAKLAGASGCSGAVRIIDQWAIDIKPCAIATILANNQDIFVLCEGLEPAKMLLLQFARLSVMYPDGWCESDGDEGVSEDEGGAGRDWESEQQPLGAGAADGSAAGDEQDAQHAEEDGEGASSNNAEVHVLGGSAMAADGAAAAARPASSSGSSSCSGDQALQPCAAPDEPSRGQPQPHEQLSPPAAAAASTGEGQAAAGTSAPAAAAQGQAVAGGLEPEAADVAMCSPGGARRSSRLQSTQAVDYSQAALERKGISGGPQLVKKRPRAVPRSGKPTTAPATGQKRRAKRRRRLCCGQRRRPQRKAVGDPGEDAEGDACVDWEIKRIVSVRLQHDVPVDKNGQLTRPLQQEDCWLEFQVEWAGTWPGYPEGRHQWVHEQKLDASQLLADWVARARRRMLLPLPGTCDVIAGGPPCQNMTGHNKEAPLTNILEDPKNRLVVSFLDIVEHLRPRFTLTEQVRDAARKEGAIWLRTLEARLLALGYQVRVGIVAAGSHGCAEHRDRVFVWGAAHGEQLPPLPAPYSEVVRHQGCYKAVEDCYCMDIAEEEGAVAYVLGDTPATGSGTEVQQQQQAQQETKLLAPQLLEDAISALPPRDNLSLRLTAEVGDAQRPMQHVQRRAHPEGTTPPLERLALHVGLRAMHVARLMLAVQRVARQHGMVALGELLLRMTDEEQQLVQQLYRKPGDKMNAEATRRSICEKIGVQWHQEACEALDEAREVWHQLLEVLRQAKAEVVAHDVRGQSWAEDADSDEDEVEPLPSGSDFGGDSGDLDGEEAEGTSGSDEAAVPHTSGQQHKRSRSKSHEPQRTDAAACSQPGAQQQRRSCSAVPAACETRKPAGAAAVHPPAHQEEGLGGGLGSQVEDQQGAQPMHVAAQAACDAAAGAYVNQQAAGNSLGGLPAAAAAAALPPASASQAPAVDGQAEAATSANYCVAAGPSVECAGAAMVIDEGGASLAEPVHVAEPSGMELGDPDPDLLQRGEEYPAGQGAPPGSGVDDVLAQGSPAGLPQPDAQAVAAATAGGIAVASTDAAAVPRGPPVHGELGSSGGEEPVTADATEGAGGGADPLVLMVVLASVSDPSKQQASGGESSGPSSCDDGMEAESCGTCVEASAGADPDGVSALATSRLAGGTGPSGAACGAEPQFAAVPAASDALAEDAAGVCTCADGLQRHQQDPVPPNTNAAAQHTAPCLVNAAVLETAACASGGDHAGRVPAVVSRMVANHVPYPHNGTDQLRMDMVPCKKHASYQDLPGVKAADGPPNCFCVADQHAEGCSKRCGAELLMLPSHNRIVQKACLNKPRTRMSMRCGYGRMWWDQVVPTVIGRFDMMRRRTLHPMQTRVFTPRENAAMHGFPHHFVFCNAPASLQLEKLVTVKRAKEDNPDFRPMLTYRKLLHAAIRGLTSALAAITAVENAAPRGLPATASRRTGTKCPKVDLRGALAAMRKAVADDYALVGDSVAPPVAEVLSRCLALAAARKAPEGGRSSVVYMRDPAWEEALQWARLAGKQCYSDELGGAAADSQPDEEEDD